MLLLLLYLLLLHATIIIVIIIIFYCYTTYITENKHINVSIYAKCDIENVIRRKSLPSIFLFILLF